MVPAVAGGVLSVLGISWISGYIVIRMIIKYFSQKRICILGERRVGKTMLFDFLSTGIIHGQYNPTTHTIGVKGRSITLKNLNLRIADSLDVTGNPDGWGDWEKSYKKADYIIYMFRADLVFPSSLEHIVNSFKENLKKDSEKYGKKFSQFIQLFNGYLDSKPEQSKRLRKNSTTGTIQALSENYEEYRNSHFRRFRDDMGLMNNWNKKQEKPIVFVGTHGILDPPYNYVISYVKPYREKYSIPRSHFWWYIDEL